MAWTMVEALVDAIKAYMTTNLPAKLDALDTEYTDTIVLDDVVTWYVGQKSVESIPEYPAAFVLANDSNVEYWNATVSNGLHRVAISVIVLDADPEVLQRKCYRYARAIWETLVSAHFAGSLSGFKIYGSPEIGFSPTFVNADTTYLGECQLLISAQLQETRT